MQLKISFFLLLFIINAALAKTIDTLKWRPYYGINVGLSSANVFFKPSSGSQKGESSGEVRSCHIMGYFDAPLSKCLSIQPALSLEVRGGANVDVEPDENRAFKITDKLLSLRLPFNLIGKIQTGLIGSAYLGFGPYLSYGFSEYEIARENGKVISRNKLQLGNGPGDNTRRMDYGINFLLGYQLFNGINLSSNYVLGLYNLDPFSKGGKLYSRLLLFSIGYTFF